MKTFTNKECQVIVKATNDLARSAKILAEHIYDSLDDKTFAHYAQPFKDIVEAANGAIYQLEKIQKRLQG